MPVIGQVFCVMVLLLMSDHAYRTRRGSLYMWTVYTITALGGLVFALGRLSHMIG